MKKNREALEKIKYLCSEAYHQGYGCVSINLDYHYEGYSYSDKPQQEVGRWWDLSIVESMLQEQGYHTQRVAEGPLRYLRVMWSNGEPSPNPPIYI